MGRMHEAEARRLRAVRGAREVSEMLARRGVKARIIGSLSSGTFGQSSDVDFLILECPRGLKYSIEGMVEDKLNGLPFDVIYAEELAPHRLDRALKESIDASDLD